MPLEDEIHARLRELTEEVRKVREGLLRKPDSYGMPRASEKPPAPAPPPERPRRDGED